MIFFNDRRLGPLSQHGVLLWLDALLARIPSRIRFFFIQLGVNQCLCGLKLFSLATNSAKIIVMKATWGLKYVERATSTTTSLY